MGKLDSRFIKPASFRNRIINGDFKIWQRGTSFSLTGNRSYTADRMVASSQYTDGTISVAKSTMNNKPSYKVSITTPPTSISGTDQIIEPLRYTFEGQHLYDIVTNSTASVTISFLFRSNVTGVFSVALRNATYYGQTGSGDATQIDTYVTSFTYNDANAIQYVTVTIPMKTTWTYDPVNDYKYGFDLFLCCVSEWYKADAGQENSWVLTNANNTNPLCVSNYTNWSTTANNYVEFAELQLEYGVEATAFEYIPYELQLMRCQRYYCKSYNTDVDPGTVTNDGILMREEVIASTTFNNLDYKFPVTMRTTPTVTIISPVTGTTGYVRDILANADLGVTSVKYIGQNGFACILLAASPQGSGNQIVCSFHYTANAELIP